MPTALYRAGDFTQALTNRVLGADPLGAGIVEGGIYDPLTTQTASGLVVRTQFPGNVIPAARMDKVALAIQNLIPQPGNSNTALNLVPSFPNDRVTTNESVKLDHQLSSNAKISGTWTTNASGAQYSQSLNGSEGLPPAITATRGTFSASYNWRVNFDYSLTPTLLLHFGAGLTLYQLNDHSPTTNFHQAASLGLTGTPNPGGRFPTVSGLCAGGALQGSNAAPCTGTGGMMNMGPGVGAAQSLTKQMTPSYHASVTWVKNNHTYKSGAEVRIFGYPIDNLTAANGSFVFSPNQVAQQALLRRVFLQRSAILHRRRGHRRISVRQLPVGLSEQRDRESRSGPSDRQAFPRLFRAGFLEGHAQADDRLRAALRLRHLSARAVRTPADPRAERGRSDRGRASRRRDLRIDVPLQPRPQLSLCVRPPAGIGVSGLAPDRAAGGIGVAYDGPATAATGTASASPSNAFSAPGFGAAAMALAAGVPSAYLIPWPNLSTGAYPNPNFPASLNGPTSVVDQNAGRPARQIQWSAGVQREIARGLVVEAAYVANRGAWWLSGVLDNYHALTPQFLLSEYGLDVNSAVDRAVLTSPIGLATAGRFQNKLPYAGFPLSASVAQALRPYPQYSSGLAPLWATQGRTWYDSLQAKATKRLSHGLEAQYVLTWAKELQEGTEPGVVNDVFNRSQNKSLSGSSRPLVSAISVNYRLPARGSGRILSHLVRDWTIGSLLSQTPPAKRVA